MLSRTIRDILDTRERPVSAVVEAVLLAAVERGASDVHFEPVRGGMTLRFRLDGVLQDAGEVPESVRETLVGRLKVLADLPTYRVDVPQEGHVPAERAPGGADLRVSVFPTVRGEKAVVRLFRSGREVFDLDDLGFPGDIGDALRNLASRPAGVLLLTGPAGSGKTTTLYALLREIVKASGGKRHVVTVEDPVEFEIDGVTQTQVHVDSNLTFHRCLRSLLRQDPEVILVGEIRDPETARIAIEAGLTGHLVLSTVHAGTAHGVFLRLLDMGVEPFLLTSSAPAVLNQRLLRVLCTRCKRPRAEAREFEPVGCERCHGTGYAGRRVAGELLTPGSAFREAVLARADEETLRQAAGTAGVRTRARELVAGGWTDGSEIDRVFGREATHGV
jgi:type II secretory ATPase GspE/PulE/Tfp pilus assembly ATPase PilB-like protein